VDAVPAVPIDWGERSGTTGIEGVVAVEAGAVLEFCASGERPGERERWEGEARRGGEERWCGVKAREEGGEER